MRRADLSRSTALSQADRRTDHPFYQVDADRQKAIIATGAQQPSPMRPVPGSTEQEYLGALTKLQGEFAQAKKILIVGAGAVGLELAGVSLARAKSLHLASHWKCPLTTGSARAIPPDHHHPRPLQLERPQPHCQAARPELGPLQLLVPAHRGQAVQDARGPA